MELVENKQDNYQGDQLHFIFSFEICQFVGMVQEEQLTKVAAKYLYFKDASISSGKYHFYMLTY